MENIRIGENCLIPDIRPENIETISETCTPSGGGEQTASYKILNVHPIINGILDKLAFFRTHAAAVWYNKLAGRTVADEIKDLKMDTIYKDVSELFTPGENVEFTEKQAYKIGKQIVYRFVLECTVLTRYGTIVRIDNSILPKVPANAFCTYQKNGYNVLAQCGVNASSKFYVNNEEGSKKYALHGSYFVE